MEFDMVFEGGAAKGMVFVGAMKEFERRGHTPRRLVGTSAGAITATLLGAGYNANEMLATLSETTADGQPVFATFMDAPKREDFTAEDIEGSFTMRLFEAIDTPLLPHALEKRIDGWAIRRMLGIPVYPTLFSFIERGGIYVGNAFVEWFERKLEEKGKGFSKLTLSEFHEATNCDLSLVASDTTARLKRVLNHRTAPNCPVAWAVRMSMSIPFVWHEVVWDHDWDPYSLRQSDGTTDEKSLKGNIFVDGGVLSNFAIDLIAEGTDPVKAFMGDTDPDDAETLGLLIDESLEVRGAGPPPDDDGDDDDDDLTDPKRLKIVRRIKRLLNTMTEARDNRLIAYYKDEICRLPAAGYGTMEFDMTDARRDALVAAGETAMAKHLDGRQLAPVGDSDDATV